MLVFQSLRPISSAMKFFLLPLAVGLFLGSGLSPAQDIPRPQRLPLTPLVIETADGSHRFEVMVAKTTPERTKGLMFRHKMAGDRGMLFDYGRPHKIAMWMKNTYLSLDMVFIRADGTIANIVAHNKPRSLRSVPSDGPVAASLELMAGTTERLGIKAGDVVRHAILGNLEPLP